MYLEFTDGLGDSFRSDFYYFFSLLASIFFFLHGKSKFTCTTGNIYRWGHIVTSIYSNFKI